jgi:hypothetical protein
MNKRLLWRVLIVLSGLIWTALISGHDLSFAVEKDRLLEEAKKLFFDRYRESGSLETISDIVSSNLKEIKCYLLKGKNSQESYGYVIQVLNPANDLCAVCPLNTERSKKYADPCARFNAKPGTDEMVEQVKNSIVNDYQNNLIIKRKGNGALSSEELQKIEEHRKLVQLTGWSWEEVKMYFVEFNLKQREFKQGPLGGCHVVGGELLFLESGINVYNRSIDLCSD